MRSKVFLALVTAACLWPSLAARGEVNINVNVGSPPMVFASPPRLVVVPESPVSYAPDVGINLFAYEGRYYSFHDGAWFFATTHRGPWIALAPERVPPPVLAVPVRYYRVPPGIAKKMDREGPRGCPPGLAKQGRC